MKTILLIVFMFLAGPLWAYPDNRYLETGKVLFEKPLEEDILKVQTSLGYCTVLEFSERPTLVTVGDNSLIQVEIPQNSKTVVIKPLQESGQTNLFVFTPSQRFNYNVTIGSASQVDYVVDAKQSLKDKNKSPNRLSLGTVLKMARSYEFFKRNHIINDREFTQKNIFYQCSYPKIKIDVIEAFTNKDPHYLLLHLVVHNLLDETINLREQNTNLYIGRQKFNPQYVLFDSNQLAPLAKTDGWLVLENSYISLENKLSLSLGVEDKEYVCKPFVS
ncbi:MAG: TrbG/VirB9 family P-type conjugative transfer protein [Candidatus Omnitrophica bacterium]|nr:TrbG/VirB9 family P-type conjugative transfer protein [Candidatus Omnitrophota bacterium]